MEYDFVGASFAQSDRILRISTQLGPDVLLPEKVEIREEINGLFEISMTVRSKRTNLKPNELIGTAACVSLEIEYGTRRPWNGLIAGMIEGPPVSRGLRSYTLLIRPQLWLLTQRSDCRIWRNLNTLQVAEILLAEHNIQPAITGGVVSQLAQIDYSVQWNETDFAYLTRRFEQDGLFYWFEHEDSQHTLHIANHHFGYTRGPETDVRLAIGSTDRNHITTFSKSYHFIPGIRTSGDWNFEMPQRPVISSTPSLVSLSKNADYELFEYPAKAVEQVLSEGASKLRMQATELDHEQIDGVSTVRTLAPGRRFRPYGLMNDNEIFEEYIVTSILHQIVDQTYDSVQDGKIDYVNSFSGLPSRLPSTPHRRTPTPRIEGSQVAIIAGPPSEEIHTDEYGRIKVWFPWQRARARKDGTDTCWIRVMQSWAGGGWGSQIIPRIGMEVMVTYLDGSLDRPVVTGMVPNPSTKVPYNLPANKTKSVFRTNTHKGQGFNELSFEDKGGNEEVFIHAQRDKTEMVNHRSYEIVGNLSGPLIAELAGLSSLAQGWDPSLLQGLDDLLAHAKDGSDEREKIRK